jgi:P27 family predicted phage terminase small subunit
MKKRCPTPPKGIRPEAVAEWRRLHRDYTIDADALPALVELCEALSRKIEAREVIERDGLIVKDRFGQDKAHPAISVERDSRLAVLRCLRVLGLPGPEEKQRGRPPR